MVLSELRQQPHLSASSIGEYVECGLLYRLSKIDKIPIEQKPDSLQFGSAIHKVLENFYREKMVGHKMLLKDVHETFDNIWAKIAEGRDDIKYTKGNDYKTLKMNGKDLLSVWYSNLPDAGYQIIGIEEAFQFSIPGISWPVIGGIDLIEEDEAGTIILTDHKTSARAYSIKEVDQNEQLTLYQIAMKNNGYEDREFILKFDTLIKTQAKRFEQYYTTRSKIDEKRLINKVYHVWDGISKSVFVPNTTSWKCSGCSFKSACDEYLEGEEYDQASNQ